MIEKLKDAQKQIMTKNEYTTGYDGALSDCIFVAESFLEKEKRQIKLNWIEGKETEGFGNTVFEDAEIYYNKKYVESET